MKIFWRREWQSISVLLPGEFHGQRSLVGYSPWGCKESDRTERLTVQFSSLTQSCPTLCDLMDCSTPGLPVHHQLPEFTQTQTISSSVVPFFCLSPSQHHGLFQWVSSSHQVAKVLEFQLQHQSSQWIFRTDLLQNGLVGSPCSPRDSQESYPTPQFKGISSSMLSFLYSPTLTSVHCYWKNHSFDQIDLCWQSNVSAF